MVRRSPALLLGLCAVLLAVPGCASRVHEDRTVTIDPGGDSIKLVEISAPRSEQKVRIEVNAADPIDVDVALADQVSNVQKSLEMGKRPEAGKVTASKQGAKTDTLETTIPAGKSFTVLLSGARKKTEVKLKINSL